jgi:hypothetical protein
MELQLLENRFGFEPIKRKEDIKKLAEESKQIFPVFFRNENIHISVIKVPIELPVYRLSNGRTLSFQEEYIFQYEKVSDFFTRDLNSPEAQMAQHDLLRKLAENKGLFGHFKNPVNKQTEPIICTNNGVIVNGNRRMSCWRDLYYSDSSKYRHFQYVEVAILPECDEAAIEDVEHRLQIAPDMKDPYCWHAETKRMKMLRDERGLSREEISKIYAQYTDRDIDTRIDMFFYAEQYLENIGKAHLWSLVTDDEFAFEQLVKNRKSISNPEDKVLFQELSFATISKSKEGRLYGKIPEIKKYLPDIITALTDEFSSCVDQNVQEINDQLSLLGIAAQPQVSSAVLAKVVSLPDQQDLAVKLCEDVIDSQKALEKEAKNSEFFVDQVRKANTILKNAISISRGRTDVSTVGLQEQIAAIEGSLSQLKEWIK